MSSSDRVLRRGAAVALVAAAMALSACTGRPLYASNGAGQIGAAASPSLADLRGRISISPANDRTVQIVRNELNFQLNAGDPVAQPLYDVAIVATGGESGITLEPGGVPRSSIYRLRGTYTVTRLSDKQVIGRGTRLATVPFDRTAQLYSSIRSVIDARQQAGEELASQFALGIGQAIAKAGR